MKNVDREVEDYKALEKMNKGLNMHLDEPYAKIKKTKTYDRYMQNKPYANINKKKQYPI